jgi:hypothetical protein
MPAKSIPKPGPAPIQQVQPIAPNLMQRLERRSPCLNSAIK